MLATELIEKNAQVPGPCRQNIAHILIDEYQDTNSASAALLKGLTKAGGTVWVVADQRQSIYRFRGAQPANVAKFGKVFGGKTHALANNYRSFAPVVRAFESFAATMGGGAMAGKMDCRASSRLVTITLTVAPTLSAEAEAIREKDPDYCAAPAQSPTGNRRILARTHLTLARITSILEELGVPLLYLGDLFERAEIKDLLCLVALGAETGNVGLVRVAAAPAYGVTRDESAPGNPLGPRS